MNRFDFRYVNLCKVYHLLCKFSFGWNFRVIHAAIRAWNYRRWEAYSDCSSIVFHPRIGSIVLLNDECESFFVTHCDSETMNLKLSGVEKTFTYLFTIKIYLEVRGCITYITPPYRARNIV